MKGSLRSIHYAYDRRAKASGSLAPLIRSYLPGRLFFVLLCLYIVLGFSLRVLPAT